MRIRRFAVGAFVLVVILIGALWSRRSRTGSQATIPASVAPRATASARAAGSSPAASPTGPGQPIHGQLELVSQILEQGLTPERAEVLFSLVVGPLPGVAIPSGSTDPADFDGTLAVSYIYQVWNSLTPEQHSAAARLIHRSVAVPGGKRSSLSIISALVPTLHAFDTGVPTWDYEGLATKANQALSTFLQVPPVRFTVTVDYDPPAGAEYVHTWSWFKSNDPKKGGPDIPYPSGCELSVHDQMFAGVNGVDADAIITHEMTHCFQDRAAQSATNMLSVPPWISEGEATWAMFEVRPDADAGDYLLGGIWKPYVTQPQKLYTDRSYDALGVFGHLSDLIGDGAVWSKLLPLIENGINGKDADAFTDLIEGHHLDYYNSWGSSYFETGGRRPWTMQGPGTPPSTGPTPQAISVDTNTSETLDPAGPYLGEQFLVSGNPDVLMVSLMTGYGRLRDQAFAVDNDLDSSAPLALCLKLGGCKCPDGSDGASMFTTNATSPLSIGINGGETTAIVGLVGHSLDDFCKQPDPNPAPNPGPPGPNGGGPSGGDGSDGTPPPLPPSGSWGDTHLGTFDGLGYDFQVVGEYTLVRSIKDDFLVQVRQVPVLGPRLASVNQAVATRVGRQRVTFTMENGAPVLRVDGEVIKGALLRLQGGSLTGSATAYGGTYQLTWSDGTVLRVEQLGSYAINVKVQPAASRRGTVVGLLGNFDGTPENDLVGANNVRLTTSRDDINQKLASAWAITPSASLFDYKPGESTASFVDHTFPAKDADAARLTSYATATRTCRAHGISDQRLLHDCVLDLAVTNSFLFGSQYAHAQHVLAARAALARPAAAAGANAIFWVEGTIVHASSEPEYQFAGKKGDVLWVGYDQNCKGVGTPDPNPVLLSLNSPSGQQLVWRSACDFGRLELPATGTYTFKGIFQDPKGTVHYRVPVRWVRPDRHQHISYGQIASGSIEQWAAHDVYTWEGKAGDLIVLSGEGCELSVQTEIVDPDGHDVLGPSCRVGTYWKLPKDGAYQLIVNGYESAHGDVTGPYHFVFQGGKASLPR